MITTPHFSYPFTMTDTGAEVVEQDTLAEVYSCTQAIVACGTGDFDQVANFGIPDVTFQQMPVDIASVINAIKFWEPRADETAVARMLDVQTEQITLTTSTAISST